MKRVAIAGLIGLAGALAVGGFVATRLRVGPLGTGYVQADGSVTSATGRFVTFKSKPDDLAISQDGRWVAVKDNQGVKLVDLASMSTVSEWSPKDGSSAIGIVYQGDSVWVTSAGKQLVQLKVDSKGNLSEVKSIGLGGGYPNGLAIDGDTAYVALSTKNQIAKVDLIAGKVIGTLDVDVAPFGMALDSRTHRLYVSEQGGFKPVSGAMTAPSAGTPVVVDERGILKAGALAEIDLDHFRVNRRVLVPTLPSSVLIDQAHRQVLVACANGDALIAFDPLTGLTKTTELGPGQFAGAFPTGLALAGPNLYVTLSGTNELARLTYQNGQWQPVSWAKTDWYPIAVVRGPHSLIVANAKGLGTRTPKKPGAYNSYDYTGTLREVIPTDFTERAHLHYVDGHGYPPIKHVVYVIKENRTYDQILGDVVEGDGDPKLVQFGQAITPNQHKLAHDFVLLDNFYCSGVLSADGHSWATEGNSTPYLERSFGGFNRSYTFGDDPLTYSSTGFIWDPLIKKGLTFRNYGEFDTAESVDKLKDADLYKKSLTGEKLNLSTDIGVKRVRDLSCPGFPGWNLAISDQYRIGVFLQDFEKIKQSGEMANLSVVYLPQDHTGGPISPQAHVADNDLAVGRLIEALSHSQFWQDTVVFVTEDDPQAGTDHVDGHRSTCLIVGPYVKHHAVISNFHTQASVLHTICDLFGVPPLNLKTAISVPFDDVFSDQPVTTPYTAVGETVALDQQPTREFVAMASKLDLKKHEVQTPRDMDTLNRAIWSATRPGERYPSEWAGAHGRGLASKGLSTVAEKDDDD